jgi:hypothetical protein
VDVPVVLTGDLLERRPKGAIPIFSRRQDRATALKAVPHNRRPSIGAEGTVDERQVVLLKIDRGNA